MCRVRNSVVVFTLELRQLIQVLIVEFAEHLRQRSMSAADVDDDSMGIEALREKGYANDKCGAVEYLGGAENCAAKRVCDHVLVGNFHSIHENASSSVGLCSRRVSN